jgi:hypothetical protein
LPTNYTTSWDLTLIGPTGTVFRDEAERLEERILGPQESALLTGADR